MCSCLGGHTVHLGNLTLANSSGVDAAHVACSYDVKLHRVGTLDTWKKRLCAECHDCHAKQSSSLLCWQRSSLLLSLFCIHVCCLFFLPILLMSFRPFYLFLRNFGTFVRYVVLSAVLWLLPLAVFGLTCVLYVFLCMSVMCAYVFVFVVLPGGFKPPSHGDRAGNTVTYRAFVPRTR